MRIRNGFVSNSSSSSFIVELDGLSDQQLVKLLNNDFSFSQVTYFDEFREAPQSVDQKDAKSVVCHVGCNQDEVLFLLLDNNISFRASCHYGHEYVQYKSDDKEFIEAFNFGEYLETYRSDANIKGLQHIPPVRSVDKSDWLEKNTCLREYIR